MRRPRRATAACAPHCSRGSLRPSCTQRTEVSDGVAMCDAKRGGCIARGHHIRIHTSKQFSSHTVGQGIIRREEACLNISHENLEGRGGEGERGICDNRGR